MARRIKARNAIRFSIRSVSAAVDRDNRGSNTLFEFDNLKTLALRLAFFLFYLAHGKPPK